MYSNPLIVVSFQWSGVHHWESAEGAHEYLRYPHRHMFHGKASIEVFHDDREIEFLAVKDFIAELTENYRQLGGRSCEWIARDIIEAIKVRYGANRDINVYISEDGENGASLSWSGASKGALQLG